MFSVSAMGRRRSSRSRPRRRCKHKRRYQEIKDNDQTRCHYCAIHSSKEHTREKKGFIDYNGSIDNAVFFAKCQTCGKNTCNRCMMKLYCRASKEARKDPWMQKIYDIHSKGPQLEIPQIPGACCEVYGESLNVRFGNDDGPSPYEVIKEQVALGKATIDGMLYLPESNLFIDSPNNSIDIHAFGKSKGKYAGAPHCCPSEECVADMVTNDVYPKNFKSHPAHHHRRRFTIPDFDYCGDHIPNEYVSRKNPRRLKMPTSSKSQLSRNCVATASQLHRKNDCV